MLEIKEIELREIRLRLKEPFAISSGVVNERRILLVEVRDEDGNVGWGECPAGEAPNYSPETIDTAWHAIENWVAPRVLETELTGPEAIHSILEPEIRGHFMAKAAVEMACWELKARKQEISLSRLLGGTRDKIATGISIGIQSDPEVLAKKAKGYLAQGYRKIKIKIMPGKDLEFVRATREALGEDAPLMVDANNAYSLADAALFTALDEFDLLMIEQPLAWDDIIRHATLQKRIRTPICLDESITHVDKAGDMIALGSGKIVNIKPGRVAGFTASIQIHDLCARNKVPVWCGGMLESGIGRSHNVALASLPNFLFPGDLSPSSRYWEQDIVTPEWTMDENGFVTVPVNKPGMGVEVDRDRVENLTEKQSILGKETV